MENEYWKAVKSEYVTEKDKNVNVNKCKKKSDELYMDCGSNDDAVYAQACRIKQ